MEQDIKQYTTTDLIKEIVSRGEADAMLEQFDDDELSDEMYCRGHYTFSTTVEDMTDAEILDELESRGVYIPDNDIKATVATIFQQKRTGRPFDAELDKLIYEITGRFI